MAKKKVVEQKLHFEEVPISKLKPWDKNPRIKHAVDRIADSIEEFGYLNPIIVQAKTYRVLAGHGRLKAMKRLKRKTVAVIPVDIDNRKAALYTVADNKLTDLSIFDMGLTTDLLKGLGKLDFKLTGFSEDELDKMTDAEDAGSAKKRKKVEFYVGGKNTGEKVIVNERTLVIVFDTENELKEVKKALRSLQAGNSKSVGQIVYQKFCNNRKSRR
jgi:ParB-like nuclease domain